MPGFINFDSNELDMPIYRIIPIERVSELFHKEQNVLVHPSLWEDPYENDFLNSVIETSAGTKFKLNFGDDFYGQCWTREQNSDAMWRIYSHNKSSVMLCTTARKLISDLDTSLEKSGLLDSPHPNSFIGKVQYLSEEDTNMWIHGLFDGGLFIEGSRFAATLLVKRLSFSHENEVRLIYQEVQNKKSKANLFSYKTNPHCLIDKMILDPRVDKSEFLKQKIKLEKLTGFSGSIEQSSLYSKTEPSQYKIG